MVAKVQHIGLEVKKTLYQHYGSRFEEIILFGSYARNDFHDESDLDFAVVFNDFEVSPATEILKITSYTSEISVRYGMVISILPVTRQRLEKSQLPVYQSIRKEGIRI
jgi:uncharacterized protein